MILLNRAKCLRCGDLIFSASVHDYRQCTCGNIFVDGGMEYIRHGFIDKSMYENKSLSIPEETYEACLEALKWAEETGRNDLGRLCAVFKAMADTGYLKE